MTEVSFIFISDPRRLEVRSYGDRPSPAIHLLHRDGSRDSGHTPGRPSHLPVRGPGRHHRDAQRKGVQVNHIGCVKSSSEEAGNKQPDTTTLHAFRRGGLFSANFKKKTKKWE